MRLCSEWVIYADDCTVRTGRCIDGQLFTDAEVARRTATAAETEQKRAQDLAEAFRECGFNPDSLGVEKKRAKTAGEKKCENKGKSKGSPTPFAHGKSPQTSIVFDMLKRVYKLTAVLIVSLSRADLSGGAVVAAELTAMPQRRPWGVDNNGRIYQQNKTDWKEEMRDRL